MPEEPLPVMDAFDNTMSLPDIAFWDAHKLLTIIVRNLLQTDVDEATKAKRRRLSLTANRVRTCLWKHEVIRDLLRSIGFVRDGNVVVVADTEENNNHIAVLQVLLEDAESLRGEYKREVRRKEREGKNDEDKSRIMEQFALDRQEREKTVMRDSVLFCGLF